MYRFLGLQKVFDRALGKVLDRTFSQKVRGQAASEFVFTYGWMIFIALLVLGSLFASGVVDLNSLVTGDQCNFPYGFTCVDYILQNNQQMRWLVGNGLGYQITLNSIDGDCSTNSGLATLDPGNQILLVLDCQNAPTTSGTVYSARLTINYTINATAQSHITSGRITTHVQ